MRSVKLRLAIFVLGFAAVLSWLGGGHATVQADDGAWIVVKHGHVGQRQWYVEVGTEGPGICLEVSVVRGRSVVDTEGRGQCSSPSPRRGILMVVANRQVKRGGRPALMAVGGAFDRRVRRVVVRRFDGHREVVVPQTLRPAEVSGNASRFRYVAFAVKGPWCAQEVTTVDRHGHPLWRTSWRQLDAAWRRAPSYDPAVLCPRRR